MMLLQVMGMDAAEDPVSISTPFHARGPNPWDSLASPHSLPHTPWLGEVL